MSDAVADFLSSGTVAFRNVQGVVVRVDGREVVRYEAEPGAASRKMHVWSVTKSVMSTLIGIAIEDGLISGVDASLAELLPAHRDRMSSAMAATRLSDLLTMSAGCPSDDMLWETMNADRDAVKAILDACEPNSDSGFVYSSTDTHVVSAILAYALTRSKSTSHMSILDYARLKLFDPLHIATRPSYEKVGTTLDESTRIQDADLTSGFLRAGFAWATDRQRIHSGCCLLKLSAVDLSKIGQLYLQNGTWEGRSVVPADWLRWATTEQVPGYGYLWWTRLVDHEPAYVARGSFGQLIMVVPHRQVVLTATSAQNPTYQLSSNDLEPMVDALLPHLR